MSEKWFKETVSVGIWLQSCSIVIKSYLLTSIVNHIVSWIECIVYCILLTLRKGFCSISLPPFLVCSNILESSSTKYFCITQLYLEPVFLHSTSWLWLVTYHPWHHPLVCGLLFWSLKSSWFFGARSDHMWKRGGSWTSVYWASTKLAAYCSDSWLAWWASCICNSH